MGNEMGNGRADTENGNERRNLLMPSKRRVAEDRRDCYWLYIVTDCTTGPAMQGPIKDPARLEWHEVTKVAHYYLSVNAVSRPMQVREDEAPYGRPPR